MSPENKDQVVCCVVVLGTKCWYCFLKCDSELPPDCGSRAHSTFMGLGTNAHAEHSWSRSLFRRICFYFSRVRSWLIYTWIIELFFCWTRLFFSKTLPKAVDSKNRQFNFEQCWLWQKSGSLHMHSISCHFKSWSMSRPTLKVASRVDSSPSNLQNLFEPFRTLHQLIFQSFHLTFMRFSTKPQPFIPSLDITLSRFSVFAGSPPTDGVEAVLQVYPCALRFFHLHFAESWLTLVSAIFSNYFEFFPFLSKLLHACFLCRKILSCSIKITHELFINSLLPVLLRNTCSSFDTILSFTSSNFIVFLCQLSYRSIPYQASKVTRIFIISHGGYPLVIVHSVLPTAYPQRW